MRMPDFKMKKESGGGQKTLFCRRGELHTVFTAKKGTVFAKRKFYRHRLRTAKRLQKPPTPFCRKEYITFVAKNKRYIKKMWIVFLAIGVFVLAFLIWGKNEIVLRDSKGRLLSRKAESADEGALVGLAYGTYTFEIWHIGLLHLKPKLTRTVKLEHSKISENTWKYSFKLQIDARHLSASSSNPEKKRAFAEYGTNRAILQATEKAYFKILNHLYLPKNRISDTTTIDTMLIHPTGIYLFENAERNGWIYGDAEEKFWDSIVMRGGKMKKTEFENPVLRSFRNEEALRRLFEDSESLPVHCFSYVVFNEKAVLKEVPESSVERKIVLRSQLEHSLSRTFGLATPVYTETEIDRLERELAGFADRV